MKRKIKFCIIIFILVILSISIGIGLYYRSHKNDFIIDVGCDNIGNMYTISYGEEYVYLKKIDSNNKILWVNEFSKTEGNLINDFNSLIVTPDGQTLMYVHQYDAITYEKVKEEIVLYSNDGKDKKIIFEDKKGVEQTICAMNYYDNHVYFFQMSNETQKDKKSIDVKEIDLSLLKNEKSIPVKTLQTISFRSDIPIINLLYTKSNEVIFTTGNSEIYKVNKNENINNKIYPIGNQESGGITSFSYDSNDNIYFQDVAKNKILNIDINSETLQELYDTDSLEKMGINYSTLQSVKFESKEKFYGVQSSNIKDSYIVTIFEDNKVKKLDNLMYSINMLFNDKISLIILTVLIVTAAIIIISFFIIKRINKGKLTIILKQLLIIIPITTISIIIIFCISNINLTKVTYHQLIEQIYTISKSRINSIDLDKLKNIDWKYPQNDTYYNELLKILKLGNKDDKIYNYQDKKEIDDAHNSMYCLLYIVKNNELYIETSQGTYGNVPIKCIYSNDDCEKYEKARLDKQYVYTKLKDSDGEWLAVISPILDENGNVVALLDVGISKTGFISSTITNSASEILKINSIIGVIMTISIIIGLYYMLLPLKKLKFAVTELMQGNLGIQVSIKSNDEVAEISRVFNKMSLSLKNDVDNLTDLNNAYHRFVPLKMFEILNKDNVTEVNIGDQVKNNISLLAATANNFERLTANMKTDEIFVFMNKMLSRIVPIISKAGGVVERYSNAGLISLFPQNSINALESAIEILENIRICNDELYKVNIGFVINKEDVMLGIIGCEERLAASVISDYLTIITELNEFGEKYGSRILVTQACSEEIGNSITSYNYRTLGYIKYKNKDEIVRLDDFFDGDDYEIIELKKQTKDIFEKGVQLYCDKDFYNARRVFIEVLKQFKEDKASKEYLKLCDKYYRIKDVNTIETYLELF